MEASVTESKEQLVVTDLSTAEGSKITIQNTPPKDVVSKDGHVDSLALGSELRKLREMVLEMQKQQERGNTEGGIIGRTMGLLRLGGPGFIPDHEDMLEQLHMEDPVLHNVVQMRQSMMMNDLTQALRNLQDTERRVVSSLIQGNRDIENRMRAVALTREKKRAETDQNELTKSLEHQDLEPSLYKASWGSFKVDLDKPRHRARFVIEVLEGEPDINLDFSESSWWAAGYKRLRPSIKRVDATLSQHTGATKPGKSEASKGKGPVPERIRINSHYIISFLRDLRGEDLTRGGNVSEAVIMMRPFKALIYFEKDIRLKVQNLEGSTQGASVCTATQLQSEALVNEENGNETTRPAQIQSNQSKEAKLTDDPTATSQDSSTRDYNSEAEESLILLQHLRCLVEFMDKEIQVKRDYLASDGCQEVLFADLCYFFSPGDVIIRKDRQRAYRIIGVTSPDHKAISPFQQLLAPRKKRVFRRGRSSSGSDSSTSDSTSGSEDDATTVSRPIMLYCVYLDFDGKRVGPVQHKFEIGSFEGYRPVRSLEVYPLRYSRKDHHAGEISLSQRLIHRGKNFIDVATVKHMHYNGPIIDSGDDIDSQVVVDFEEACPHFKKAMRPKLDENLVIRPPWHKEIRPDVGNGLTVCTADCCRHEFMNLHYDYYAEQKRNEEYMASLMPADTNLEPSVALFPRQMDTMSTGDFSENELLIMCERVFGFILRSRRWAMFDVANLTAVTRNHQTVIKSMPSYSHVGIDKITHAFNVSVPPEEEQTSSIQVDQDHVTTAFDHLVLPERHKDIVVSLVAQHYRDRESKNKKYEQVDIVRGKGKGLILLLHGAPGVGKTTTAEGVAELFGKPLYQITCGDLGTTAQDVEKALNTTFALASRWGCILLLDEAEVFLAARTPQDFARNGMVSVFLRVLEYYTGILFLTTNRIGDFDEAFVSRIHVSLHYPQLDLESTLKVFKLNLRLIQGRFQSNNREIKIEEGLILSHAKEYWETKRAMRWNGRQIRNACQTALALAEFDAQGGSFKKIKNADAEVELTVRHLEIVSSAYQEFLTYLKDVSGVDADLRAKRIGIRAMESKNKRAGDPEALFGKLKEEGHQQQTAAGVPQSTTFMAGPSPAGLGRDPSLQSPGAMSNLTASSVSPFSPPAPYPYHQPHPSAPPHTAGSTVFSPPQAYYPPQYGQPPWPPYVAPGPNYHIYQQGEHGFAPPGDQAAQEPRTPTRSFGHPA